MQQVIACSKDAFAFGEPDEVISRNYDYLLPEDCLPLEKVRQGFTDPKYGYRYKMIWDAIASFIRDEEITIYDMLVALVVISNGPLFIDLRSEFLAKDGRFELLPASDGLHLQLYVPSSATDQSPFIWPAVGRADDIPVSLSQSDLELASSWLHDCTQTGKHHKCDKIKDPPFLPTRVLDVGISDAETRLYISHPGEKSYYVALSHCWGGVVPTMTTKSNIDEFVRRAPSQMPKTFANAIAVTRNMGQRYLWIDSFCIVQDSVEDWWVESSKMDQVYSQALFTIVADAAENSSSGFLEPPARKISKTSAVVCSVTARGGTAENATVHVRERGDLGFQLPYHDFHTDGRWKSNYNSYRERGEPNGPKRSKLSTRAWAFQERLLSPRTLHFGPREMAWECRTLCSCECSAMNERSNRNRSLLKGSIALLPDPALDGESEENVLRSLDNAWRVDIIEKYTMLDLTRDTDRLSGLAGLATRALTLRPGDEYISGLWRNTIRAGLSWYTMPERPSIRPQTKNILPTWSWASVSGQIQHARVASLPSDASLIDILEVQYKADPTSPFGAGPQVPASLLCAGYLVSIDSVWFQPYTYNSSTNTDAADIFRSCYRVKWPSNIPFAPDCIAMMDVHKATAPYDDSIQLDRLDGVELESMNLVLLLTAALPNGEVHGLVLSPRGLGGDLMEYERVGFVNGRDSIGKIAMWTSSSYSESPLYVSWEPEEDVDIGSILDAGGITKRKVIIW